MPENLNIYLKLLCICFYASLVASYNSRYGKLYILLHTHTHTWFWGNNWSCGLRLSLIVVEMHIYDFHTPYELIGSDGGGGAAAGGAGGG